jgi:hypothetical protein
MPLASLDNLVRVGQLKAEPPAESELDGLIRSGLARLKDAENEALSLDGRLISPTTLPTPSRSQRFRWHGYRSDNRYLVFQTLAHTLKLRPNSGACLTPPTASGTSSNI